jgi:uncharacterized protein
MRAWVAIALTTLACHSLQPADRCPADSSVDAAPPPASCHQACRRGDSPSCEVLVRSAKSRSQTNLDALDLACGAGTTEGCRRLGVWATGEPSQPLTQASRTRLERTCGKQRHSACAALASVLYASGGSEEAEKLWRQSCKAGEPWACHEQAQRLRETLDSNHDTDESNETDKATVREILKLESAACRAGVWPGCYVAAVTPHPDGLRDSHIRLEQLKAACVDIPLACFELGRRLEREGRPREAVAPDESGCKLGSWESCGALADLILSDEAEPLDTSRAARLQQQACELGRTDAQWDAPYEDPAWYDERTKPRKGPAEYCAEAGEHWVQKKQRRGIELLARACDGSIARACASVGRQYETGELVRTSQEKANGLYQRACRGHNWTRNADGTIDCPGLRKMRVRMGSTHVSASMGEATLIRAFNVQSGSLSRCLYRNSAAGRAGGDAKLAFAIERDGTVSRIRVSGTEDDDLAQCFSEAARDLRFPPPESGALTITGVDPTKL